MLWSLDCLFAKDNQVFGKSYVNQIVFFIVVMIAFRASENARCQTASIRPDTGGYKIRQISFGPSNHLFGYIGHARTIPWNRSGRYVLSLRSNFQDHMPLWLVNGNKRKTLISKRTFFTLFNLDAHRVIHTRGFPIGEYLSGALRIDTRQLRVGTDSSSQLLFGDPTTQCPQIRGSCFC